MRSVVTADTSCTAPRGGGGGRAHSATLMRPGRVGQLRLMFHPLRQSAKPARCPHRVAAPRRQPGRDCPARRSHPRLGSRTMGLTLSWSTVPVSVAPESVAFHFSPHSYERSLQHVLRGRCPEEPVWLSFTFLRNTLACPEKPVGSLPYSRSKSICSVLTKVPADGRSFPFQRTWYGWLLCGSPSWRLHCPAAHGPVYGQKPQFTGRGKPIVLAENSEDSRIGLQGAGQPI